MSGSYPAGIPAPAREDLLREIDARWSAQDAYIQGLTDAELRLPVPFDDEAGPEWNVGVAVAHVAHWKRNGARVAELQREPFEPDDRFPPFVLGLDLDPVNDDIARAWHGRSREDVLAEHLAAHAALLEAIRRLPDGALIVDGRPVAWLHPALGHSDRHFDRHVWAVVEAHRGAHLG